VKTPGIVKRIIQTVFRKNYNRKNGKKRKKWKKDYEKQIIVPY